MAKIIAREFDTNLLTISGQTLRRPADLVLALFSLPNDQTSFLFIDEIDRLPNIVAETLCEVLEDGTLSVAVGSGNDARSVLLTVPTIVCIGATMKPGALSQPLRDRFGFHAMIL